MLWKRLKGKRITDFLNRCGQFVDINTEEGREEVSFLAAQIIHHWGKHTNVLCAVIVCEACSVFGLVFQVRESSDCKSPSAGVRCAIYWLFMYGILAKLKTRFLPKQRN